MTMNTPLHFVVAGARSLARGCCEILVEHGHCLDAVVSDDEALRTWARARAIPAPATFAALPEPAPGHAAPVLLSVANEKLVPAAALRRFADAINYHNGPLPRYAGSHAPSWALIARERTYAITWHRMTEHTDAGDILLQCPVPIAADDTALTLNAKCHDAALEAFPRLLHGLAAGGMPARAQNLSQRTFFPRERRPRDSAVLDWTRPADDLSALVRALTFGGGFVNRLGLPKILLSRSFAVVRRLTVGAARSQAAPGTVVAVNDQSLVVSTASHNVAVGNFFGLDGRALPLAHLVRTYGLREGTVLATPDLGALDPPRDGAPVLKHEGAWMEQLRRLKPLALPLPARTSGGRAPGPRVVMPPIADRLAPSQNPGNFAFVTLLIYLARAAGMSIFDIGLADGQNRARGLADALMADVRPFRVDLDVDRTFTRFHSECLGALGAWRLKGTYLRDAVLRYPGVKQPRGWDDFASWPVTVQLGGAGVDESVGGLRNEPPSALRFDIDLELGEVMLHTCPGALDERSIDGLEAQLAMLLDACIAGPNARLRDLRVLPEADRAAVRRAAYNFGPDRQTSAGDAGGTL